MERPPADHYSSPHAHDFPSEPPSEEEYAPLRWQWGLIVWILLLMGLVTAIVLVVESIPSPS